MHWLSPRRIFGDHCIDRTVVHVHLLYLLFEPGLLLSARARRVVCLFSLWNVAQYRVHRKVVGAKAAEAGTPATGVVSFWAPLSTATSIAAFTVTSAASSSGDAHTPLRCQTTRAHNKAARHVAARQASAAQLYPCLRTKLLLRSYYTYDKHLMEGKCCDADWNVTTLQVILREIAAQQPAEEGEGDEVDMGVAAGWVRPTVEPPTADMLQHAGVNPTALQHAFWDMAYRWIAMAAHWVHRAHVPQRKHTD